MTALFDSHLDLGMNALGLDRDLLLPLEELNAREIGTTDHPCRSHATITIPEMRAARTAFCCGTLLARVRNGGLPGPGMAVGAGSNVTGTVPRFDVDYASPEIAHATAASHLAYYEALERSGDLRTIRTASDIEHHWNAWHAAADSGSPTDADFAAVAGTTAGTEARAVAAAGAAAVPAAHATAAAGTDPTTPPFPSALAALPIGNIISMEGSDPIIAPDWVPWWFERGLRVASLVHYGRGRYAHGTGMDGPLTDLGVALLKAFEAAGMILDLTHISDSGFFEASERFGGRIMASHNNCRTLVPGGRQFTDDQIRTIIERGGVIGVVADAWMLYPGWVHGKTDPEVLGIESLADHIDHICEIAGNTHHAAIGSDLDGLYGSEQTPRELKRYRDLWKLDEILKHRGYGSDDRKRIFSGNWYRFFREGLPRETVSTEDHTNAAVGATGAVTKHHLHHAGGNS